MKGILINHGQHGWWIHCGEQKYPLSRQDELLIRDLKDNTEVEFNLENVYGNCHRPDDNSAAASETKRR